MTREDVSTDGIFADFGGWMLLCVPHRTHYGGEKIRVAL